MLLPGIDFIPFALEAAALLTASSRPGHIGPLLGYQALVACLQLQLLWV